MVRIKTAALMLCVIAAFLCLIKAAGGHDAPRGWSYDQECCSDRDCAPIPAKGIQALPDGSYMLPTGEVVGKEKIKRSQDEEYHLCRLPGGTHIFCLYVPPFGS